MSVVPRLHRYTYSDYVGIETYSDIKHEYIDGEIYAMSGGTGDHAKLSLEVLHVFRGALPDRRCDVYTSDLRIWIEAVGLATYPDGSVIGGPIEEYPPGPKSTALNPMILLEVTSDSSEEHDTGTKYEYYRTIPTLRDYVIVSHSERRITIHSRGSGAGWTTRVAARGERAKVPSLGAELIVDEIYLTTTVAA